MCLKQMLTVSLTPISKRSSIKILSKSHSRNVLKAFINNSNVVDIWRLLHPTERDHTFHSQVHNVYTCTANLVDGNLIFDVLNSKIHDILIFGITPLLHLKLLLIKYLFSTPNEGWTLKFMKNVKDFMNPQLKIFFENNDRAETTQHYFGKLFFFF